MMSNQILLKKERDFLELNKELEDKVKSLMIEVDTIISRQEDVMRSPKHSTKVLTRNVKTKHFQPASESADEDSTSSDDEASPLEKSIKSGNIKESLRIIESEFECCTEEKRGKSKIKKKRSTNETIIRFLKAQVTKLQTDIQAVQFELKKKNEHCKELETEIKKQEEKKEKLHSQISAHKETILKAEVSHTELQSQIQSQTTEMASLRKEIEALKRDLKSLNQLASNSDLRLNRSLEENEKLRSSLKTCQGEEKELREQIRKIQEEKRLALKSSEKQRNDIFQAFKKQTQLVDNLKRQKAYLEASKEIQFIEEDFTKLLEWKPDKS